MLGNLFQQFYNMADTVIVGQFVGKSALSAVGSVGALNFLIVGSVIGLCSGFAIPIAQRFGAQDIKGLKKYVANIIYTSAVLAVVFTAGAVILTNPLLKLLNTPEEIYGEAYSYIVIIFAGISATMFYNLLASIVRALGDSKTPLYFLLFSLFFQYRVGFAPDYRLQNGRQGSGGCNSRFPVYFGCIVPDLCKKEFSHSSRYKGNT